MLGLKAHGRRLPVQPWLVEVELAQVRVHGRFVQQVFGHFDQALRCFYAVLFQQLNHPFCGNVAPLFIGGAQFDCGNNFAVVLELCQRKHTWFSMIGAVAQTRFA